MKKRWMSMFACAVLVITGLSGCGILKEERYGDMHIGEVFCSNRDGHFIRLPQNYCLCVELNAETSLFKVSEEDSKKLYYEMDIGPWIISGHYILEYYNNDYLVLCEETQKDVYRYVSFRFDTQEIQEYPEENTVLDTFQFSSDKWRPLCNTYAERGK